MTVPLTTTRSQSWRLAALMRRLQFAVPRHQRYYDWRPDNVRKLLDDLLYAFQTKKQFYFLGTVVLYPGPPSSAIPSLPEGERMINDGQQRLVTFSLVCAILCKYFHEHGKDHDERRALRILFDLGEDHDESLDNADSLVPRLQPPRRNKESYLSLIRGNNVANGGKLSLAVKVIREFFHAHGRVADFREKFFQFLVECVEISCIEVPLGVDPNDIFEVLNARGKPLEQVDLVKSYFFSHFNASSEESRLDTMHDRYEGISTFLGNDLAKVNDYFRFYLQTRFGHLPDTRFYSALRDKIDGQADVPCNVADRVYALMGDLHRNASIYKQILSHDPDSLLWKNIIQAGGDGAPRDLTHYLHDLRGYRIAHPILLALFSSDDDTPASDNERMRFKCTCAKFIASFVMRICHTSPKFESSHFERHFSAIAKDIRDGKIKTAAGFMSRLKKCADETRGKGDYDIISDEKYKEMLNAAENIKPEQAKRILIGIVEHEQDDIQVNHRCTLEHILPKSVAHVGGWNGFNASSHAAFAHRLGNCTLLGRGDNKSSKKENKNFATKREFFRKSSITMTSDLSKLQVWGQRRIKARQKDLAARAAQVWNFTVS